MLKINPKTEIVVNTPNGTRIEGQEKIGEKVYTWMRYVTSKENENKKEDDDVHDY